MGKKTVDIALIGDIGLFGRFTRHNPEIYSCFYELSEYLKKFDFVIGNLETPLCRNAEALLGKSAHIKGEPEDADLLNYLHITHVNLANNHMFDFGTDGYLETLAALKKNGIHHFGTDGQEAQIESNGTKLALSGFCCYSSNALCYLEPGVLHGVNVMNGEAVETILQRNHENGYLNIASFHCGQEHVNYPHLDHIDFARKLASRIPYIYYGHHPHVLQGCEQVLQSHIFYSLGNFCFDDVYTKYSPEPLIIQTENNRSSVILELCFEGNELIRYAAVPIFDDKQQLRVNYDDDIVKQMEMYSEKLALPRHEYQVMRDALWKEHIETRKRKRNFSWYFKRLNFNSVKIILNARMNRKKYQQAIKDYLKG